MSRTGRQKALVLGEEVRSLLGVVRSLGRGGIEVHVAWHAPGSEVIRSRFLRRAHRLPPFDPRSQTWKDGLIQLMKREAFDLVIPCTDPAQFPLQTNRADLEPEGRIYLLEDDVFHVVTDKFRTTHLARSVGVPVPREVIVAGPGDRARVRTELALPVVLKPRSSFDARTVGTRARVHKAYTLDECERLLAVMLPAGSVAVQENFIGRGVGVELLLDRGEPLLSFQHVRLHEPLRGGGSSYRKSVSVSADLLAASLALLAPLRYTGVAMVEFKVNPQTGRWVLLEINGRFWGSLPLAVAAGADFPLALFRLLVDGCTNIRRHYRVGICCRNWRLDRTWLWANLRADRSDPTLATRPVARDLWETGANLLLLRERSDTFTLDDPGPGFAELKRLAQDVSSALGRKARRAVMETRAGRRWLERSARNRLRASRTVLFVCQGNICRSPFAQRLAEKSAPSGRSYLSAGYHPQAGRPCPEAAVAAAARRGLDLSGHRSQILNEQLAADADAILVFDFANYERVRSAYPRFRRKVHLLAALSQDESLVIDDPYGQDKRVFEETYERIARLVESAARSHVMCLNRGVATNSDSVAGEGAVDLSSPLTPEP